MTTTLPLPGRSAGAITVRNRQRQFAVLTGSVHDGYLAMFIEVGVLGAIPFFVFLFLRILYVWREAKRGTTAQMVGMGFIIGFLAVALVQPLMLNLASPLPTLAWCFILGPPASYGLRATEPRVRIPQATQRASAGR